MRVCGVDFTPLQILHNHVTDGEFWLSSYCYGQGGVGGGVGWKKGFKGKNGMRWRGLKGLKL